MDPAIIATIAASAVNALVPFVKKGLEKLTEKTADEAFNKRAEIWQTVKGLGIGNDLILPEFEANPEDARIQGKLEGKIEEKLKTNQEALDVLENLLKQLKEAEKNKPAPKNVSKIKNEKIKGSIVINDVDQS